MSFDPFRYVGGTLCAEQVPLDALAEEHGTPLYVYSAGALLDAFGRLQAAFGDADPLIAYSVKANPNLAVIRLLAQAGAGADVVSGGELTRALRAGVPAERIVFAGVGKRRDELEQAVSAGVASINVEVEGELEALSEVAVAAGREVNVGVRVNPDVPVETHKYIATGTRINKFGIPMPSAREVFRRARDLPGLRIASVACHIGSQLLDVEPFRRALAEVRELILALREDGITISHVDVGGGVGVRYADEQPIELASYAAAVREAVGDLGARIVLEPGRVIAANAGVLLTRVLYRKQALAKQFLIVDAGMNDLARPSLYGAHHALLPVREGAGLCAADVVGPICETGDFLAQDREVPDVAAGELIAACSAGAYGQSMASNYNTRPRAAEVLVRGDEAFLIAARERVEDLLARDRIPAFLL